MRKLAYRFTRYEFWPWYMMFIPILPVYFYGVLRTRKLLYFTATNPSIDMGGFFGERKDEILALIPEEYKAEGIHVLVENTEPIWSELVAQNKLNYPLVAKPTIGERGNGVRVIHTQNELAEYALTEKDFILQAYVDYPLELGVLYYKYPNDTKGKVSSITEKLYMHVDGDGIRTVRELIADHPRHFMYSELCERQFPERMDHVPPVGEHHKVHSIGNHVKGTQFLDGNEHISQQLNDTFTRINDSVAGVYFGRYDLKVPSYADLQKGVNIKIFELNGVSSEPGHIYDQSNVFKAYRSLADHWLALVHISHQNIKKGVKTTPLPIFFSKVKAHFVGV